jgi:hypothetical protein
MTTTLTESKIRDVLATNGGEFSKGCHGAHSGLCCALEAVSLALDVGFTDEPRDSLSGWDACVRCINDANWQSRELCTNMLIPLCIMGETEPGPNWLTLFGDGVIREILPIVLLAVPTTSSEGKTLLEHAAMECEDGGTWRTVARIQDEFRQFMLPLDDDDSLRSWVRSVLRAALGATRAHDQNEPGWRPADIAAELAWVARYGAAMDIGDEPLVAICDLMTRTRAASLAEPAIGWARVSI